MENTDRVSLLAAIQAGRAAFDTLLGQFAADELETAYPPDGWSVKDMMAHIAYWENYALGRLQEAADGSTPQLLGELTDEALDRINQAVLDAGPAQPLAAVQADYARVYQELWTMLQTLPDATDDPWWDLWPGPDAPLNLIRYNTTDHYEEHASDLRRWLDD